MFPRHTVCQEVTQAKWTSARWKHIATDPFIFLQWTEKLVSDRGTSIKALKTIPAKILRTSLWSVSVSFWNS